MIGSIWVELGIPATLIQPARNLYNGAAASSCRPRTDKHTNTAHTSTYLHRCSSRKHTHRPSVLPAETHG